MRNSNRIPDLKKPRMPAAGHPHALTANHHPHDSDLVHGFNSGRSPLEMNHPDHNPMGPPRRTKKIPDMGY